MVAHHILKCSENCVSNLVLEIIKTVDVALDRDRDGDTSEPAKCRRRGRSWTDVGSRRRRIHAFEWKQCGASIREVGELSPRLRRPEWNQAAVRESKDTTHALVPWSAPSLNCFDDDVRPRKNIFVKI